MKKYCVGRKSIEKLDVCIRDMSDHECIEKIHFVGIGGSGMSGIAKILVHSGYAVSGSDVVSNNMILELIKLGVKIFFGHQSKNVHGSSILVISSAISLNNPEVVAAKKRNILIIHRSEMLEILMRSKCGIAISGTHGKSTTTAMIVNIHFEFGLNSTFVNGEIIKSLNTSAHLGNGKYFIAEADESDASFLCLYPIFGVITNIEKDHMDTYRGDFRNLKNSFFNFLCNLPLYGVAVVCLDDLAIRELVSQVNRKVITYGFSKDADLCIIDYFQKVDKSSFVVCRKNMSNLHVVLNMPGRHNALNSTAAIAIAVECGIDDDTILRAMLQFQGVSRRFECLGIYNLKDFNGKFGEVILVNDYGHHPVEVDVTIETMRIGWPDKRLVMVFQPHRFTRMRDLYGDFVKVLSKVDVLLMLDVYSAGEIFIQGFDSASLCSTIRRYGKIDPVLVSEQELSYVLSFVLQHGDFLLMQGAGKIGDIAHTFFHDKFV